MCVCQVLSLTYINIISLLYLQGSLRHDKENFQLCKPIELRGKVQHLYWLLLQKGLTFAASWLEAFSTSRGHYYYWAPTAEVNNRGQMTTKRVSIDELKFVVSDFLDATRQELFWSNEFKSAEMEYTLPTDSTYDAYISNALNNDPFTSGFHKHVELVDKCFPLPTLAAMIVDILLPVMRAGCFDSSGSSSIHAMTTWARLLALCHPALATHKEFDLMSPTVQQLIIREGKVTGGSKDNHTNTNVVYMLNQDSYCSCTGEHFKSRYYPGFGTENDEAELVYLQEAACEMFERRHLITHWSLCPFASKQTTFFVADVRTDILTGKNVSRYHVQLSFVKKERKKSVCLSGFV